MRRIKPDHWFFICWVLITALSGVWQHFSSPPDGMHQGAQADRACVAWNYYTGNMDFFHPRVMENRISDGVTGMEFPVLNYAAACLYRIAGPHEFLYRGLMFAIVTAGVFAAFRISGFFMRKTLSRLCLVFGWFLSPVFLFYGNSFIPDPASLSLAMIALFYFLRFYFNIQTKTSLCLYLLFTAIAGLVKITYLIPHFSIIGIYFIQHFNKNLLPGGLPKPRRFRLLLTLPLIPVTAWYLYSGWLTQKTGNLHFLQQINPARTIPDFLENSRYAFNTWQDSIYKNNVLYIILALFLIYIVPRWREARMPALLAAFTTAGFILAFVLFNFQYRYHDYYFFLLLLPLFFMLLFLQQIHLEGRMVIQGLIPLLITAGFYYLPFGNFFHARHMLKERYTRGSYYHQGMSPGVQEWENFREKTMVRIPDTAQIFTAYDPSPNTNLYLLRHRGVRMAPDFSPDLISGLLRTYPHRYLVISDTARWNSEIEPQLKTGKVLMDYVSGIALYSLPATTGQGRH